MTFWYGSGSAPLDYGFGYCSFLQWLSRWATSKFLSEIFLLVTVGRFTSVLTYNKLWRHKTERFILIFFFAYSCKDPDPTIRTNNTDLVGQKLTGPTNKDPEHWLIPPFSLSSVADPGSGALLTPGPGSWIRMGKKSWSVYGKNNPDHISERLETIFRDPGWKKSKSGIRDGKKFRSGINIPDPQHFLFLDLTSL